MSDDKLKPTNQSTRAFEEHHPYGHRWGPDGVCEHPACTATKPRVSQTTLRPRGSNADEWRLFLACYVDDRATSVDGLSFVAVQVAEAIEAERERCAQPHERLAIAAAVADERERCAKRVEWFFAPCSGVLERRYGRDLAGHIREGT